MGKQNMKFNSLSDSEFKKLISRRNEHLINAGVLALMTFFLFFSLSQMNINPARIARGTTTMLNLISDMFPPDLAQVSRLWPLAVESIQIAILGTVLGIIFSLILSMFAAKNLTPIPGLGVVLKGFFAFTRAVPALVWALLFITAVGLGTLPGILALGVNSIGMLGKVFSESFENIDKSTLEGLNSTGASRLQVFSQGVVPETIPVILSWSLFRFDINIRYSSILGVVGAGGIGWELVRASRMRDYPALLMVILVILIMVYALEQFTSYARKVVR